MFESRRFPARKLQHCYPSYELLLNNSFPVTSPLPFKHLFMSICVSSCTYGTAFASARMVGMQQAVSGSGVGRSREDGEIERMKPRRLDTCEACMVRVPKIKNKMSTSPPLTGRDTNKTLRGFPRRAEGVMVMVIATFRMIAPLDKLCRFFCKGVMLCLFYYIGKERALLKYEYFCVIINIIIIVDGCHSSVFLLSNKACLLRSSTYFSSRWDDICSTMCVWYIYCSYCRVVRSAKRPSAATFGRKLLLSVNNYLLWRIDYPPLSSQILKYIMGSLARRSKHVKQLTSVLLITVWDIGHTW